MGRVNLFMLMVMYMMETGQMIKLQVLEFIIIIMEQNMKVNGQMIFNMEKVYKLGLMVVNIRDGITQEKKMVKESMFGKMEVIIVVIGQIIKSQGLEYIIGRMEEDIRALG